MTWEIFLGITALVGFFITIGAPILKLNTSIIRLNESVNVLRDTIAKNEVDNKEAHKRIWDHMDNIDETMRVHEGRLQNLENSVNYSAEKINNLADDTADQEHRITVIETKNNINNNAKQ